MSPTTAPEAHRRFLNAYYGPARHYYDLTRKYYLFGRDRALRELVAEPWSSLVEVGPGTGRNLRVLHKARPEARLGGLEPCDEMLAHARTRCPWAALAHGFAESADLAAVLGGPPDRVLFSYCLSMVGERRAAIARARRMVAPGGSVVAVDFADMATMPAAARSALRAWLGAFHVTPLDADLLDEADSVLYGPMRYYAIARFRAAADVTPGRETGSSGGAGG
jgi:S-adenosylmethionine-diacylgycerolhomoserine-N-methlytransferase